VDFPRPLRPIKPILSFGLTNMLAFSYNGRPPIKY